MSLRDDFRDYALGFEGAWLDHSWDFEGDVFKTAKGKIFLMCGGDDRSAWATVKLTHAEGSSALTLPFVRAAAWPLRWVTATVTNEVERDIALEWVSRSHELVSAKG
jgi:predicted DNA-binding protein (MmcQ/YjbR family)